MDYCKFFKEIDLCGEGVATFFKIHTKISDSDFKKSLYDGYDAFCKGNECFEKFVLEFAAREGFPAEEMHLYLTVIYAEAAYGLMKARGIPEEHFYRSFKDVARNCKKQIDETGIAGLEMFELPWFRYSIEANIYLLGRLQFQVAKSEYDYKIDGCEIKKGDTVLFVHVPGSDPLTEEACSAAYGMALDFFGKYYGMEKLICFCYSWLLQPWVEDVLAPTTNIIKFKKTFELIETNRSIPHTFRFIFKEQSDNFDDYPTDNSLRRTAVERAKRGDLVGYGVGVRVVTSSNF